MAAMRPEVQVAWAQLEGMMLPKTSVLAEAVQKEVQLMCDGKVMFEYGATNLTAIFRSTDEENGGRDVIREEVTNLKNVYMAQLGGPFKFV